MNFFYQGTALTEILQNPGVAGSTYTLTSYTKLGTSYTFETKIDTSYANSSSYSTYPYAVAGPLNYQISGIDIGYSVSPIYDIFTSTTSSITLPANWTKIFYVVVGGGGGGGGGGSTSQSTGDGGNGGGGGGMTAGWISRSNYNVTTASCQVGAGGAGGNKLSTTGYGNGGSNGTYSYFRINGLDASANAGTGGGGGSNVASQNSTVGVGGVSGSLSTATNTILKTGSNGLLGTVGSGSNNNPPGGAGGDSGYTLFTRFQFFDASGNILTKGYGDGGNGGLGDGPGNYGGNGIAGNAGVVILCYYFN